MTTPRFQQRSLTTRCFAALGVLGFCFAACSSDDAGESGSGAGGSGSGAASGSAPSTGATGSGAAAGTGSSTGSGAAAGTGSSTGSGAAAGTGSSTGSGGSGTIGSGGWKNVVIGGGGYVTGLLFHPTEPGLLYARTDMGGAYRWDEAGNRWLPLTDFITRDQADSMGVLSLALDPNDPDRVYLLTGKYTQSWAGAGAVLVSTDRGATFTRVALTAKIGGNENGRGTGERLVVDPNDGATLWLGTTADGLWKSTDHGASFTKVTGFTQSNVSFVLVDPASGTAGSPSQTLYAAVASTTNSLLQSTNGGASWTPVAGQPNGLLALRGVLEGTSLFVTLANVVGPNDATAGAFYRLDTAGGGWTDISPPTGSFGFSGVSVDPADPEHMVVSTLDRWGQGDEIYQTTNGGAAWTPLLASAAFDFSQAPYAEDSTPHWITDVAFDPADTSRAWFVTGYGVFECSKLNAPPASCEFEGAGMEQTVAMQLVSPPEGAPLLSALGDLDGFKHDDLDVSPPAGRHRPHVGTTLGIAFAELLPNKLVKAHNSAPAGSPGSFGSLSIDGGVTWTAFASSPAGAAQGGSRTIAIAADGSNIVWSPRSANAALGMFYSSNDGDSWTASSGGVPVGLSPVADRVNPAKFYAFDGLAGQVFVSSNGGAAFAAAATGLPTLADWQLNSAELSAAPGHEGDLWLATGDGGLSRSTDSGATFTAVAAATKAYRVGFGKAAPGASYPAVFVWGTVNGVLGFFRSDDEGGTFSRINDDAHQFGWAHSVVGDPRVYGRVYVGLEGRGIQYRDLED
jgi:hypothetical protein